MRCQCIAEFSGFFQFMSQYQQCLSREWGVVFSKNIRLHQRHSLFFPPLIAEHAVLWLLEFKLDLVRPVFGCVWLGM